MEFSASVKQNCFVISLHKPLLMKTRYIIIAILLNSLLTQAQNAIPNAGFENWSASGGIFGYEDPVDWGTSNSVTTTFQFQTATKATSAQFVRSGNYALRLETHYIGLLNLVVPGGVATSELEIDIAAQSVIPVSGVPFNLRPTVLEGWYQYYPAAEDSARVAMLLRRWNPETQMRDTIAIALFETTEGAETYTQFTAPFEYQSDLDPDTMLLGILCGKVEDAPVGTVMYVDDLDLIYDATITASPHVEEMVLYPNPTSGLVWVENPNYLSVWIVNSQGVRVRHLPISHGLSQIDMHGLPQGRYVIQFLDKEGRTAAVGQVLRMR